MNKSTQNLIIYGGIAAAIYYFMKNSSAMNPVNQMTPAELLASTNATIGGSINSMASAIPGP